MPGMPRDTHRRGQEESVTSSTRAEPPTEDDSSAPAGEIEMKTAQDLWTTWMMRRTDHDPGEDEDEDEDDTDSYVREEDHPAARLVYELNQSTQEEQDDDVDAMSYEAGKSKTAEAIAIAAGGSTYIDFEPRTLLCFVVRGRPRWCDRMEGPLRRRTRRR